MAQGHENVLPLKRQEIKKLAVIGKLADTAVIGDHGSSRVYPPYVVTPLAGLKKANGSCEVVFNDGADIQTAKELAAEADAVIFVVGYNFDDEGEFVSESEEDNYTGFAGGDRKRGLGFHEDEVRLIQEIGSVNQKSTVVLVGGNMIMMTEWYDSVNAVIMAYYPSMEAGTALRKSSMGTLILRENCRMQFRTKKRIFRSLTGRRRNSISSIIMVIQGWKRTE